MLSPAITVTVVVLAFARFWLLPIGAAIAGAGGSLPGSSVGIERRPLTRTGPICNIQSSQRRTPEFETPNGSADSSPSHGQAMLYREIMRMTALQSVAPQYVNLG